MWLDSTQAVCTLPPFNVGRFILMFTLVQVEMIKHFMIGNSPVDTLLFADDQLGPVDLGKRLSDGCTLIKSYLQGFWITDIHVEDQTDGFSRS